MENREAKAHIFGTIFTLSNKLQLLGDMMDPALTVKQWLLLAGVMQCSGSPTLSEVAARIGSSRQNVKKMAAILEKRGFVRLEKDPADARMLRIRLTDACRAHLRQREGMELRFIDELFEGFGTGEVAEFSVLISKLDRNVSNMRAKYDEKEA